MVLFVSIAAIANVIIMRKPKQVCTFEIAFMLIDRKKSVHFLSEAINYMNECDWTGSRAYTLRVHPNYYEIRFIPINSKRLNASRAMKFLFKGDVKQQKKAIKPFSHSNFSQIYTHVICAHEMRLIKYRFVCTFRLCT